MKKTDTNSYEKRGEASSYTVREGKKGWIVESWSAYTGTVSGRKVLLPYWDEFPRGCNLNKYWSEFAVYGDMLFEYSKDVGQAPHSYYGQASHNYGRVLRKGRMCE